MARTGAKDGSRRSPKWQERRDAIIDTSAGLFAEHGYHATGINDLCEGNDLGKGALYHYIGSKEELLAALGEELLDVIHRYPDHVWVFLHEFPALTGERAASFRERRGQYEKRVEAVLRAGVDSGDFRDVDPWLTARAWFGMHNYTYLWLKPGGRLTAKDVAEPFAAIFTRGIATPKRRR